jgi:tripartite-type tricarboxylate transporter receptor subunit TctC
MKLPRRAFLHLAAGAAALPATSKIASSQSYPARPVRLVVGFPAGSTADILARLVGGWLSERLNQPFIIENRPGAGSNVAAETVLRAPGDGYTLLWITSANAINATLYDDLSFNFIRDVAPIASVASLPLVMEVNPSFPAQTVPEFIAYAKANRGKINMASGGNGSSSHLAGELFKMMAGVDMVHVPYRGDAPAITDLLSGRVQVMFDPIILSLEHIRAGRLRALAVTATTRSAALPDVPTVGDFVPAYEADGFTGLGAPNGTPAEILGQLNSQINAGLADDRMQERLADLGATILTNSPSDFGKRIAADTEKWGKVVKFAGIKTN